MTNIEERLDNHEKRLQHIESLLTQGKKPKLQKSSITFLIQSLKDEGFFLEDRLPKQILEGLAERGHTYRRLESLTWPLKEAVKRGIIKRKKKEGKWVYYL